MNKSEKYYIINDCQAIPNQYINKGIPKNKIISREDKSTGDLNANDFDAPNIKLTQDLKKNEGPIR